MSRNLEFEARILRLGLMAGVFSVQEIILWADDLILKQDHPAYELLDLSLMGNSNHYDVANSLEKLGNNEDFLEATRVLLGFMYRELLDNPEQGPQFARGLEEIAILSNFTLPEELYFFYGLYDEYSLAAEGIKDYQLEGITKEFLNWIQVYEKYSINFSHLKRRQE